MTRPRFVTSGDGLCARGEASAEWQTVLILLVSHCARRRHATGGATENEAPERGLKETQQDRPRGRDDQGGRRREERNTGQQRRERRQKPRPVHTHTHHARCQPRLAEVQQRRLVPTKSRWNVASPSDLADYCQNESDHSDLPKLSQILPTTAMLYRYLQVAGIRQKRSRSARSTQS